LPTRYPTKKEINECRWLIVTGDNEWDPYDPSFADQESQQETAYDSTVRDRNIAEMVTNEPHIATQIFRHCSAISSTGRKLIVTDATIAKIFNCSPEVATKMR
jgi:hypothetical protein